MLYKKKTIVAKIETVYGTDAVPAGADAIVTSNLSIEPYEGDKVSRDIDRPNLGLSEEINTGAYVTLSFDVEIAGSGTAGTAPGYGSLLRACGFSETINAGTDVVYQPVSEDFESITIHFERDGELQKVPGCRGSVSLKLEKGQLPKFSFSFTGLYQRPVAGSLTPDWSKFKAPIPVNEANTPTFTVHGYEAIASAVSIDMANEVKYRNVINQEGVIISDRAPTGQLTIDAPTLAAKNFFTTVESHNGISTGSIQVVHGVAAGHIVQIDAPSTQLSTIKHADLDGFAGYELSARYLPVTGDDEIVITVK